MQIGDKVTAFWHIDNSKVFGIILEIQGDTALVKLDHSLIILTWDAKTSFKQWWFYLVELELI